MTSKTYTWESITISRHAKKYISSNSHMVEKKLQFDSEDDLEKSWPGFKICKRGTKSFGMLLYSVCSLEAYDNKLWIYT